MLKLRPQRYDVIITEPSNPWAIGVGSVFSREFYEVAASRLKTGGIMAQWFHLYETQDSLVELVLRTFSSVFPYVEVWDTGVGDIVILGSQQPWPSGPEVFRQGFAIERVRTDMEMIDMHSPEALMARQLASQRTGFAIAGKGPVQSDLFPILEDEAPRAFYLGSGSSMLDHFDERTYLAIAGAGGQARNPPFVQQCERANHIQRFLHGERTIIRVACSAIPRARAYLVPSKCPAYSAARGLGSDFGSSGAGLQHREFIRSPTIDRPGLATEAGPCDGGLRLARGGKTRKPDDRTQAMR